MTTVLDRSAVDDLIARARREIDEGLLPSCQFALARDGEVVEEVTLGETPAGDDSQYVVFSASKVLVVAALWQLLAEKSLALSDRVGDLVPEFATNGKEAVTVGQVLQHTSGFARAPLRTDAWSSRDLRLEAFSRWRLNAEPGERFEYHLTAGHWVLAEILERIDGVDFRQAVSARICEPLGLSKLSLGRPVSEQDAIARPTLVGEPASAEELQAAFGISELDPGEATDDALVSFARPEVIAAGMPGAGAVSNAGDFALLYQAMMHNPGGLWDPELLADATGRVQMTEIDMLRGVPANRGLGVMIAGDDGAAAARGFGHTTSPRAFGHDGAGGQIAFADPTSGLSFVYLTNGLDRNIVRLLRRSSGIASRAGKCA